MRKAVAMVGVVCLVLAGAMALAAEEPEAIQPKEKMELFNGKDFTGWTFCLRGKNEPGDTFKVEEGVIKCSGRPAGYMRTEKAFKNYKLTVEWRFIKPGNSGVLVHMSGQDRVWPRSLECQGQYHAQGDFWVIGGFEFKEHKAGGKRVRGRNVRKLGEHNEKKLGEWNVYEILCDGTTVIPSVNGKVMNEAHECSDTSGKICIQSEGAGWECRKVTVEPITK